MKDIWPRAVTKTDIETMDVWLKETPQNLFDRGILNYRDKMRFYCAHNGSPVMFAPLQSVLMVESLGVKPDAAPWEVAKAMETLIKYFVGKASDEGYNELYFISGDETLTEFARKHEFTEIIRDTEKKMSLFFYRVTNG